MKDLLVVCWVMFTAARLLAAEEPRRVYSASNVLAAPVIDGTLNEVCWQAAAPTAPFVCIGGAAAPVATVGMMCWDATNLYVAFVCDEPSLAALQRGMASGTPRPWEESVELFLDIDRDRFTCTHLRMDILGNRDSRPDGDALDPAMDQRWKGAVALGAGRWTVEMAIPFEVLGGCPSNEGALWGINLNRSSAHGWMCWSDTKGAFLSPDRFGDLVFHPYPVFLRSHFAARFRSAQEEIERLDRRSGPDSAQPDASFAAFQTEDERFLKSLEFAVIKDGQEAAAFYARGLEQERKLEALRGERHLEAIRAMAGPAREP